MSSGLQVVSKGNDLIKKAVWSFSGLTVEGSQQKESPPGCSDVAERRAHLIIYFFCCSFFLRGSVFCSTRRSEGGERMPNKAAEGMHSQEVRVRL